MAHEEESFWRSDIREDATGEKLHLEDSWEFVGPLVPFVLEVEDVHRLKVVGVTCKDNLAQELITDDVMVPDLAGKSGKFSKKKL